MCQRLFALVCKPGIILEDPVVSVVAGKIVPAANM
jgi:hypothetical protein